MELIKLYPDDLSFYEESCYWRILMRLRINDKWKTILKRNTPKGQYWQNKRDVTFREVGNVAKIDLFGVFLDVNSIQYVICQKWTHSYYPDVPK